MTKKVSKKKSTPSKGEEAKPKKKMGAPTKMTPEKIKQLKAICRLKPTLEDCASFLDVDKTTIENWIRKEHDVTFSVFRQQNMVPTRFMIIRNILKECEKGNTAMLIYASKNLCGWSDKVETSSSGKIEIVIDGDDKAL